MSGSSGVWILLGSALAGAAAGPFVLPGPPAEMLANRERIASLSPSERTRLDQKFHAYEALLPEQRQALQTLHAELAQDQTNSRGIQTAVMKDYVAWLNTIPAYRREELLQEPDPGKRIEKMKGILEMRHSRMLENPEPGGQGRTMLLTPSEVATIMKIVEQHVRESLGEEEQAQFDKLSDAFRQADAVATLSSRIGPMQPLPQGFGAVLSEIAAATGREGIREVLRRPGDGMAMRFLSGLNMALLNTAERNLKRELSARRVSDADLEGYFKTLSPEQQDALTNLSADDFRSKLRIEYLGRETAVVQKLERELRRVRQAMGQGPGGRRPDGMRPDGQGPGPGDDRGGPPRGREGGRPFEGRREDRPGPDDRGDRDRPSEKPDAPR